MRNISLKILAAAMTAMISGTFTAAHADDFKAEVKYAQVGDVKIAYYTRGQGAPLLMISGYASTMSIWDPELLELLSQNHTLIMYDHRGVGLSTDTAENNTTIPQMADDGAGLLKAIGYEKADILGWSMGARISQQFLIRHPDVVNKAVLVAPNAGGSTNFPATDKVENTLNDPSVPVLQKVDIAYPDNDVGRASGKDTVDRLGAAAKAGVVPNDFEVSAETLARQTRARTTLWSGSNENFDNLKNIKNPVLITGGRFDLIDLPRNANLIANQIPYSWLAFYDGGHAFLFQFRKQFAATVDAFLMQ